MPSRKRIDRHSEARRRTIDRYLSRCGAATRGEAARLVAAGRVKVNGQRVTDVNAWINIARDEVTIDGKAVELQTDRRIVAYNKPRGVLVTANDPEGRPTVLQKLPEEFRKDRTLRPVGRLDKASGGLLLLTNDNDLSARILDSNTKLMKFYRVKVRPAADSSAVHRLRIGVDIGDKRRTDTARVEVERESPKSSVLRIGIHEGRNRQIRRMATAVGCEVEWLVRIAIGPIELGDAEVGSARDLSRDEVEALLACVR
ncbi:MAG: pseudouridine synthase [Planctomycetota bacterium]